MIRFNTYHPDEQSSWICGTCGISLVDEGVTVFCGRDTCPLPSTKNVDTRMQRDMTSRQMRQLAELMETEL